MAIGERIRLLREKKDYSQNRLAELSGISQSHLRRVELGESRISVDHLQMVCDALGVSLKEFFDYTNEQDELISVISTLSPKQKKLLLEILKSL